MQAGAELQNAIDTSFSLMYTNDAILLDQDFPETSYRGTKNNLQKIPGEISTPGISFNFKLCFVKGLVKTTLVNQVLMSALLN